MFVHRASILLQKIVSYQWYISGSFPKGRHLNRKDIQSVIEILPKLLFRHFLGKGAVYVFTWSLDVLTYKADTVDDGTGEWDWIWKGIASELGLARRLDNPIRAVILEMMPGD